MARLILDFLQNRRSHAPVKMADPGPDAAELDQILACAMSAPDHGALGPQRFMIIRGLAAKEALGRLFVEGLLARHPAAAVLERRKEYDRALHGGLVVVVVARLARGHPKIPETEQLLSVAMGAEHLLLAAEALGYGAMLVSGARAVCPVVRQGLNLGESDVLVGFVHIGHKAAPRKLLTPRADHRAVTTVWPLSAVSPPGDDRPRPPDASPPEGRLSLA